MRIFYIIFLILIFNLQFSFAEVLFDDEITFDSTLHKGCKLNEFCSKYIDDIDIEKFIKDDVHETFKIKNFTEKAAGIQAKLRAKLEQIGKPTQKEDSMIAAIALANHMVLVTRNTRLFEPIQEVSGLQIENWFE